MKKCIEAKKATFKNGRENLLTSLDFNIQWGESWAIIGPSGSGKTLLCEKILRRALPQEGEFQYYYDRNLKIGYVSQQHIFKKAENLFYQARFNSNEAEESPLVMEVLLEGLSSFSQEKINQKFTSLGIEHVSQSRVGKLSNGESKRLQLARALLKQPSILILDQPFVGLDVATREKLHQIINQLISQGTLVILSTSIHEIPDGITHIMQLNKGHIEQIWPKSEFLASRLINEHSHQVNKHAPSQLPVVKEDFQTAIRMESVGVKYAEKTILENISWQVKRGEKWALTGHNGAGKSTLLSLVTGDNPQAYANKIWLFDRRRGSGESIWDIKKRIGYMSPELHVYFRRSLTCFEAISSGFADRMVPAKRLTEDQQKSIQVWMEYLEIAHLKDKTIGTLSTGEQRLVLLARAMVKNPAVIILDEPCQGLDDEQVSNFLAVLEAVCNHPDRTLIYVSHYAREIPFYVDQILKLENGQIVY